MLGVFLLSILGLVLPLWLFLQGPFPAGENQLIGLLALVSIFLIVLALFSPHYFVYQMSKGKVASRGRHFFRHRACGPFSKRAPKIVVTSKLDSGALVVRSISRCYIIVAEKSYIDWRIEEYEAMMLYCYSIGRSRSFFWQHLQACIVFFILVPAFYLPTKILRNFFKFLGFPLFYLYQKRLIQLKRKDLKSFTFDDPSFKTALAKIAPAHSQSSYLIFFILVHGVCENMFECTLERGHGLDFLLDSPR